jgi:hypothetical protein
MEPFLGYNFHIEPSGAIPQVFFSELQTFSTDI